MVMPEIFFRLDLLNTSTEEIEVKITRYIDKKISVAKTQGKALLLSDTLTRTSPNDASPYYLVYQKNKLITWTSNKIPNLKPREVKQLDSTLTCINLGNGYYIAFSMSL